MKEKQKEWTIIIYMAGDNNLAVDMAYAMEQIKGVAAAGPYSPNLFVYYDGNSPDIPTLYCDFSELENPRYVRSFKVPNKLLKVPKKTNENAANWRSIVNFVDWCVNKVQVDHDDGEVTFGRRANRYALIFAGHSLGFQDIGLFKDETSGKSMKMDEFGQVLRILTANPDQFEQLVRDNEPDEETGELPKYLLGQKLDILGFDSCVMGMLEVGYQFEQVTETIIASEGSVPSAGWTYAKILGCLAQEKGNKLKTKELAELFVNQFVRSQDAFTVGGVSVDMAAWDLSRFRPLVDAFDGLSEALTFCFAEEDRIYRQMERIILKVHWQCQSYMFDQNVDLGDFCELLDRECGLVADELGEGEDVETFRLIQDHCKNVNIQLRNAVILSGFSGPGYQYSNGISVFFPWSREGYEVSKKNYESLWFVKDMEQKKLSWTGFLQTYLYKVSRRELGDLVVDVPLGAKYRYPSGVKFSEGFGLVTSGSAVQRTKIAGQENTRIAGQENTRIAGQENTRIAGQENTRIAGQENTRIAGQENTRIAGGGGSGGFFNSLQLFKNVAKRWDISGFTKRPPETNFGDD